MKKHMDTFKQSIQFRIDINIITWFILPLITHKQIGHVSISHTVSVSGSFLLFFLVSSFVSVLSALRFLCAFCVCSSDYGYLFGCDLRAPYQINNCVTNAPFLAYKRGFITCSIIFSLDMRSISTSSALYALLSDLRALPITNEYYTIQNIN